MERGTSFARRAIAGLLRPGRPRRILALDLETTGLDSATAEVIAVGTIPVVDGVIRLGDAWHSLVRPREPDLAVNGIEAHHLRPGELADAPPLADVVREVVDRLEDVDALLVHHAPLDVTILRRACRSVGVAWPGIDVLDTVAMLDRVRRRRRIYRAGTELPTDLAGARRALGLPAHLAHDALADAIATAELYLVLAANHR